MKSSSLRRFTLSLVSATFVASYLAWNGVAPAAVTPGYKLTSTMKLGGEGRWDYVTLDAAGKFLYVTRTTHTMVVDVATGKTRHDIAGQERSHGVALVPAAGRGFISDGKAGAVLVFDLNSGAALGKVAAADDADSIIYDPASNRVLVFCGDAHRMVAIAPDVDPKGGKASATARVRGGGRSRQGIREYRGQGRSCGRRYETDEGDRAMADRAGSAAYGDVDGSRFAAAVRRLSKQKVGGDERRRWQDRGGFSDRRVCRRDGVQRYVGLCELRRRDTHDRAGSLGG